MKINLIFQHLKIFNIAHLTCIFIHYTSIQILSLFSLLFLVQDISSGLYQDGFSDLGILSNVGEFDGCLLEDAYSAGLGPYVVKYLSLGAAYTGIQYNPLVQNTERKQKTSIKTYGVNTYIVKERMYTHMCVCAHKIERVKLVKMQIENAQIIQSQAIPFTE